MNKRQIRQVAAGGGVLAGTAVVALLGVSLLTGGGASAEPEPTQEPVLSIDLASHPYINGLAAEQEAAAAAVVKAEQERLAAEAAAAEAARMAAEQAAAAEAERTANEQAAADSQVEEPVPTDNGVPPGYWPVPWIPSSDPNNANGGDWDMSQCFTHGEWINGATYCAP